MILSVVIPFHVVNDLLERSIDSIISQPITAAEVIAVGDGCSDEDWSYLQYKYPLLRVICIPKLGANAARIKGLSESKGEYVLFVDSDDTLSGGAIEKYLTIIEQSCANLIVANTKRIEPSGDEKTLYRFKRNHVVLDKKDLRLSELYTFPILINKCFRKSLLADVLLPESDLFQDAYISAALFLNAQTFYFSNDILYHYHRREGSTSNKPTLALSHLSSVEKIIEQLDALYPFQTDTNNQRFICVFCARLYYTLTLRSSDQKHFAAVSEAYRKRGYRMLSKRAYTLFLHPKTAAILILFSNRLFFKLYFHLKSRSKAR